MAILYRKSLMDRVFQEAQKLTIKEGEKLVFVSDVHRGVNDNADDFSKNARLYQHALEHYYKNDFRYFELGDGDELWENRKFINVYLAHKDVFQILKKFHQKGKLHMLWGNHDMDRRNDKFVEETMHYIVDPATDETKELFPDLKVEEGIRLTIPNLKGELLLIHGHQVDPPNYLFWFPNKFLVRYFWRSLQQVGFQNPISPSENPSRMHKVTLRIKEWLKLNPEVMIMAGHTHRSLFPKVGELPYYNTGSCVHPRGISAIEYENGCFKLVYWGIQIREDGSLHVAKQQRSHEMSAANCLGRTTQK